MRHFPAPVMTGSTIQEQEPKFSSLKATFTHVECAIPSVNIILIIFSEAG